MLRLLEKQSYLVVLLVSGIMLVVLSIFDVKDMSKLQVDIRNTVIFPLLAFGVSLSCFSLFFYSQDRLTLGWFKSVSVHTKGDSLHAKFGNSQIEVVFGKIQDVAKEIPSSMVVLPANEYFDDECIHASNSSLGAYVQSAFTNKGRAEVQQRIKEELGSFKSTMIEKEPGVTQASYGVGSGVFLNEISNSEQPVLFISVTTKRAGEGLRAELSNIFRAVKKIQEVAADHRVESVCIPIIGTGHGGLRKEVGLFSLVLAICDGVSKPSGHHIKNYHIVVYRNNPKEKPLISISASKRILKTAIGLFAQQRES